jgi:hypothetical protein
MPEAFDLAREAGRFWASDPYHNTVKRATFRGACAVEFRVGEDTVSGIAYDGEGVWTLDRYGTLIRSTPAGEFLEHHPGFMPGGSALAWDRGYLWIANPKTDSLYRVCLHSGGPFLGFDTLVVESPGCHPGEEARVWIRLLNSGDERAVSVTGSLFDPGDRISMIHPNAEFGEAGLGETCSNEGDPFVLRPGEGVPEGTVVYLELSVATGTGVTDTLVVPLRVGAPCGDYLVCDLDPNHSSGPVVHSALRDRGYEGEYTTTLYPYRGALRGFRSLWIFLGQWPVRDIISFDDWEAESLRAYLLGGEGGMYAEGAEAFYYDPRWYLGLDFGPLFGLIGYLDGGCDLRDIMGVPGVLTGDMKFRYSGENQYIDRIAPDHPEAFVAFENSHPSYTCGIGFDAGDYRTFAATFEMGGLLDGPDVTVADLVDTLMHFFGAPTCTDPSESSGREEHQRAPSLHVEPSMFYSLAEISWSYPGEEPVGIVVHDVLGRRVRTILKENRAGADRGILWDGTDAMGRRLPAGAYFIRLEAGNRTVIKKVILL